MSFLTKLLACAKEIASFGLDTFNSLFKSIDNIKIKSPYLRLMRVDRPLPYLMLGLPILWFLTAISSTLTVSQNIQYWIIAIISIFSMRSAGCIINDIADWKFDRVIERTKSRPIASGELSVKQALFALVPLIVIPILLLFSFFSRTSILIALVAALLTVLYPYAKRFTGYAQVILGITWNAGILIFGFTLTEFAPLASIVLYCAAVFWTIAYDSIYALQDAREDSALSLHSLPIKFENSILRIVQASYNLFIILVAFFGLLVGLRYMFLLALLIVYYILHNQVEEVDIYNITSIRKNFLMNCIVGMIIWLGVFLSAF